MDPTYTKNEFVRSNSYCIPVGYSEIADVSKRNKIIQVHISFWYESNTHCLYTGKKSRCMYVRTLSVASPF